jgi:hypothetical protein
MADLSAPLKLFAHRGRDPGLMVVGSPAAMAELATQLSAALAAQTSPPSNEWPPELVSASVQVGPFIESEHWRISFHVEGAVPSERKALLCRGGPPGWFSLATLVLSIIGVVSLLRLVWNAV